MEFSLKDAVLTINGVRLTGFENVQDAISVAPVGDDGDITYGINDDAVFIHSCNQGVIVTIKTLQHAIANKLLNDLRKNQVKNSRASTSNLIIYEDLRNGDKFTIPNCWFITPPTLVRGTAHNGNTWTLKSASSEIDLKEGK